MTLAFSSLQKYQISNLSNVIPNVATLCTILNQSKIPLDSSSSSSFCNVKQATKSNTITTTDQGNNTRTENLRESGRIGQHISNFQKNQNFQNNNSSFSRVSIKNIQNFPTAESPIQDSLATGKSNLDRINTADNNNSGQIPASSDNSNKNKHLSSNSKSVNNNNSTPPAHISTITIPCTNHRSTATIQLGGSKQAGGASNKIINQVNQVNQESTNINIENVNANVNKINVINTKTTLTTTTAHHQPRQSGVTNKSSNVKKSGNSNIHTSVTLLPGSNSNNSKKGEAIYLTANNYSCFVGGFYEFFFSKNFFSIF